MAPLGMKVSPVIRVGLLVGVIACAAASGTSKVAGTTLGELIASADLIVVGTVTKIIEIRGVRVAEVEVLDTLKGAPSTKVYYLAQPTWICDTTTGTVGETAVFFFTEYVFDPKPRSTLLEEADNRRGKSGTSRTITFSGFREPPGFREEIDKVGGSTPLMQVHWSGRGRMPIRELEGVKYVTVWTEDVALPADVETIEGPEPEYTSFIRSIQRSVESIKRQLD